MFLTLSLLAMSALAQDVRCNYAKSVDFSKYTTYKWVQIKGGEQLAQPADQQLRTAIDAELAEKGLPRSMETPTFS
jgi:hypothetical protein